ncbi:MAG: polyamine aminopropyltransferase [Planktomarina sp.]
MIQPRAVSTRAAWLLVATFLVAVASLIYELIAATLSSYLLGDSVRQFSFVIGVFLTTMGIGAYLSRYVSAALVGFVWVQLTIGVLGGALAPALYFGYAYLGTTEMLLYAILGLIGILSGMEIPLIARVLKEIGAAEFRFENVLSVDYAGALVAALAFPLLIVPQFGLMTAGLLFGTLNLAVAGVSIWLFRDRLSRSVGIVWAGVFALALVAIGQSERIVSVADAALFEDDLIISETTQYQKVSVTQFRGRTRLFLDYSIQFDTLDEYRYHEALVHPAMTQAPRRRSVLILGGGDGMAVREVLKYSDVDRVTLVDLDPRVTEIFRDHAQLAQLNEFSLSDPRVTIVSQDAWQFAQQSTDVFDVILIDLPDPKNISISKLYSGEFYALLMERLSPRGVWVSQAGSPLFARQAYWSIVNTMQGLRNPASLGASVSVVPYHVYVPSFGDWGFVMMSPLHHQGAGGELPDGLKFWTPGQQVASRLFDADSDRVSALENSINSHVLLEYYRDGWNRWFQ